MFLKGQKSVTISITITGLIVVSEDMQVIGIILEKDMLRLLYEEEIGDRPVLDIMTKFIRLSYHNEKSAWRSYLCLGLQTLSWWYNQTSV